MFASTQFRAALILEQEKVFGYFLSPQGYAEHIASQIGNSRLRMLMDEVSLSEPATITSTLHVCPDLSHFFHSED